MPYYKKAYDITFTNGGGDDAAKLKGILKGDDVLENLVTLWENDGPYTFPVGQEIEGSVDPRRRVMGGELIHTILGKSNLGNVQNVIYKIKEKMEAESVQTGAYPTTIQKIYQKAVTQSSQQKEKGVERERCPMIAAELGDDPVPVNSDADKYLLKYIKYLLGSEGSPFAQEGARRRRLY